MKVASWNVNSLKVRLEQVLDWLDENRPDVFGLQETKLVDEAFPVEAINDAGYEVAFTGQKTYNGVALLTRYSPDEVIIEDPELNDPHRRFVLVRYQGVSWINVYVPNGQEVGSEKYRFKLEWLTRLQARIARELAAGNEVIVMGDFNIAPEDRDVHDPDAWQGKILCSQAERGALQEILQLGLVDSFRLLEQEDNLFSWWDYRQAGFRRNRGLRIDLILCSEKLAARCQKGWIDTQPRALERPSDHAPVVAEFEDWIFMKHPG